LSSDVSDLYLVQIITAPDLLQECTRFTSDLHQVHIINAPGKKTGFWEETRRREEQEECLHAKDVVFLIYIIK
jgi:hypothetical protein